jgi:hypothetical protein
VTFVLEVGEQYSVAGIWGCLEAWGGGKGKVGRWTHPNHTGAWQIEEKNWWPGVPGDWPP